MDVRCDFGNVNFGTEVARVSCRVARSELGLSEADESLCGKRVTCRLTSKKDADQKPLPGMDDGADSATGVADVKGFSVRTDVISFGLAFAIKSVNEHDLVTMRRRSGRLIVEAVEDLPDAASGDDDDGVDDHPDVGPRPLPGQKSFKPEPTKLPASLEELLVDTGASRPLTDLCQWGLTKKKCEQLASAVGGSTVGHLEQFQRAKPEFWNRDIKGFGEEWITKLQDAHEKFRREHPAIDDEDRKDAEYTFGLGKVHATDGVERMNEFAAGSIKASAYELGYASVAQVTVTVTGTVGDGGDDAPDEVEVDD